MSVRFILLWLAVGAILAPARATIDRVVEKTFPALPGATLKIDTAQGIIRVQSADQNDIRLIVHEAIDATTEAEADRCLGELDLRIEKSGNFVDVSARYRRSMHWTWQNWPPVALSYEVTVPRVCNVELRSRGGDITIGRLRGSVHARTGNGAVFVDETDGTVTAESGRGDIAVTACNGALTLSAMAGNVLVGRAGGAAKIDGAGGVIEIQNARGPVKAVADNSDLKINFIYPFSEKSELRAAGGDIAVSFDKRSACTVTAHASTFGAVRLRDLPLSITSGRDGASRVEGKLNGGGPTVRISASGGNVRLSGYVASP